MATDWKDLIPVRGEAEVSAKLKGSYGGKSMRSRGGRRFGARSAKKDPTWSAPMEGDAALTTAYLTGAAYGLGSGSLSRLFSFNYDTPTTKSSDAEGEARSVSRMIVQMEHHCVPYYWVDGTVSHPYLVSGATAGWPNKTMGGDLSGFQQLAPISEDAQMAINGISLWLFWMYETYDEAQAASPVWNGVANASYERNRRVFKQELVVTRMALGTSKWDIRLPNVRLGRGDRETYQVTLACSLGSNTAGSIGVLDGVKIRGWGKAFYKAR